ncbi:FHA domain-containing protein [Rhodoferax antarcticus]|uniref:Type IV secretion system FHA domain protein n=1 Tax=Rhodoferax antarcticus ANT.BR TaxID=1111071 RepID=A0A1Q8YI27_9BURK|nr:FHA domain-containing protein [Rhodoferax antarcticus]APW45288.1 FHA domain-containing protein [Rhodoferax antarcticus]OLP07579.1 type IV secretion system FHA domain protein [Rhodoferax antarcticus ANT.BR]
MPKITVMMDGVVHSEVTLTKERTTIGRRPYNDVVIENLTVSGEHGVLIMDGKQVSIEDLHSTNGTYIDGKAVKRQVLRHGDVMDMGKYKVKFDASVADEFGKTMLSTPRAAAPAAAVPPVTLTMPELRGSIKVLSGAAAGREMALTKVVTTVGKPGVSVAAVTQRRHNFFVHHVEGHDRMTLNGDVVGAEPVVLKHGDRIMLAGTEMQFLQG